MPIEILAQMKSSGIHSRKTMKWIIYNYNPIFVLHWNFCETSILKTTFSFCEKNAKPDDRNLWTNLNAAMNVHKFFVHCIKISLKSSMLLSCYI